MFIAALIVGMAEACLALMAAARFEESKKLAWSRAGIFGVIVTLVAFLSSKVPAWISMILFVVTLAMMGYLIWWWRENGSTKKELAIFVLMMCFLTIVSKGAIVRIRDLMSVKVVIAIFESIPGIMFFLSVGYMIANMIWFHAELEKEGGEDA